MWICSGCGSNEVESKIWCDLNTDTILDSASDGSSDDNWCRECEEHVLIIWKEVNE